MISNDFVDGGFPVSKRAPIICFKVIDGVAYTKLCYNRFDLAIEVNKPGFISCLGVWPGKKTTDGFVINPEAYTKVLPPEEHKDIDSANEIIVMLHDDKVFSRIIYTIPYTQASVECFDEKLYHYVKTIGLQITVKNED